MHPLARACQILFLLGGLVMFAFAWSESTDNGWRSQNSFRFECTTQNVGTEERPEPKETCESKEGWSYMHDTDETMVSALAGVGLMIGAAAVSVGGARRDSGPSAVSGPQPHAGAPLPVQPQQPHQVPQPPQVPQQPHQQPPAGPPRNF